MVIIWAQTKCLPSVEVAQDLLDDLGLGRFNKGDDLHLPATLRAGHVGITSRATLTMIRNCRIMDNTSHGLELFEERHPLLYHCLITANGQNGVMIHAAGRRTCPHRFNSVRSCHGVI